jgi:hypothetical protein
MERRQLQGLQARASGRLESAHAHDRKGAR